MTDNHREIEFTEYVLPHGHTKTLNIRRPEAIAVLADRITDAGYHLEAEVLRTGQVSLTIADRLEEQDLAIVLISSGEHMDMAVDKLITDFATNHLQSH